jgi:heptaprenylglyceryl phosphate synthase
VPTLKQVEQQLLKQIVEFVAKREDLPVIREEENGNMIMRAVF